MVLNRRKLAHNPQQLLLARYRQTLEDEDDNIVDDVKLTKESVDQVQKMILQMQKETATLFYKQKILLEGPDKTNHHATVIQTSWRRLALMRRWRALRRQAKATPDKWDAAHQVAFMHGHKGKFRKMQAPSTKLMGALSQWNTASPQAAPEPMPEPMLEPEPEIVEEITRTRSKELLEQAARQSEARARQAKRNDVRSRSPPGLPPRRP